MDNVEFAKRLGGLVEFINDVELTDCQRTVVRDTMLDMLQCSSQDDVVDSDSVPLTLEEVKEKGLDYYVYDDDDVDVYDYKINNGWTLAHDGKILCENVKVCMWICNGRYWYVTYDGKEFYKTI